jgi:iron complex transport system substrate-binding protein
MLNRDEYLQLWNYASIRVLDVRRMILEEGEELRSYRLPASAFVLTTRGRAKLLLDGMEIAAERFHVLHGGKGMCLDILAEEMLEYYLILYKAMLPLPARKELLQLMERDNAFTLQLSFTPPAPIGLLDKAQRMFDKWSAGDSSELLHIKALFYQFVHELSEQAAQQEGMVRKADYVSQAIGYMQDNYSKRISLQDLSELLDCSASYLSRMFKREIGQSPIDYLIALRITKSKELLLRTDATLQEIAESVGFVDSGYFNRIFRKHVGLSPSSFKSKVQYNPEFGSTYALVANGSKRYIGNGYEYHSQYKKEGQLPMYQGSRLSVAAAMLICLTLLLAACGGANNANTAATASPTSAATTTTPAATDTPAADNTRVIKHAMGEETLTGTPERVVILTNEGTEALLAVGIKPVGAVQSWVGDPWYDHIKNEMQDVTVVGDELQPNIELIASLKPDLIIGNKVRQEKIYEQLKQIAPTVFAEDLMGDWKINFKLYTQALNKEQEGEQAMAAFDERVAQVKAKVGDKAETKVSVVRFTANQVRIYQKQTFSGVLLQQLGFARPESQDKDSFIEVMSKETIPAMDGDVMFYFVSEDPGTNEGTKVAEEWMNDPLFKNLNVAKNNKVVKVDEAIWNTAGGYKAANLLLDEIVKYFDIK